MDYRFLFSIGITGFVLLSGCASQAGTGNTAAGEQPQSVTEATGNTLVVGNFDVEITDSGYVPSQLTIKKGSTVTWTNNSEAPNWPASAQHPTHTVYPGSGIEKCGTDEENEIFDSCGMELGESWSFTFNEAGEWGYHEHNEVKTFGKIIVVE